MKKFLLYALLIVAPLWWISTQNQPKSDQHALATVTEPEPEPLDLTNLDAKINQLLEANKDMAVSISIADLERNKYYQYGDTSAYEAASATKLITAVYLLHAVESGQISLQTDIGGKTAGQQLQLMIEVSDNEGWHRLNDHLTKPKLAEYAASIGLTTFDAEANTVSSNDIALLLAKLYQEQLINKAHTDLLLSHMKKADSAHYIPAAVRPGLATYHKSGYLQDRILDTAIISDGKRAFVLVVFTKGSIPYDSARSISIIHEVTKTSVAIFLPEA